MFVVRNIRNPHTLCVDILQNSGTLKQVTYIRRTAGLQSGNLNNQYFTTACLRPLIITILTFELSRYPYQKDKRPEHRNLTTKLCSFSSTQLSFFHFSQDFAFIYYSAIIYTSLSLVLSTYRTPLT